MPENKEFEKWFRDIYRCCDEDSVLCAFEKDSQDAFEAGQQSERDKRRWISVTERLPTEKDKRENTELFGVDEEKDGCVHVPCYVKIFPVHN